MLDGRFWYMNSKLHHYIQNTLYRAHLESFSNKIKGNQFPVSISDNWDLNFSVRATYLIQQLGFFFFLIKTLNYENISSKISWPPMKSVKSNIIFVMLLSFNIRHKSYKILFCFFIFYRTEETNISCLEKCRK